MLLAGAIFVLTIVLVIWQPKGLGIGWSAMLGAGLALISGVVHVSDIPVVWNTRRTAYLLLAAALWHHSTMDNAGTAYFRLDGPLLCGLQRWYLVLLHPQQWRRVYGP